MAGGCGLQEINISTNRATSHSNQGSRLVLSCTSIAADLKNIIEGRFEPQPAHSCLDCPNAILERFSASESRIWTSNFEAPSTINRSNSREDIFSDSTKVFCRNMWSSDRLLSIFWQFNHFVTVQPFCSLVSTIKICKHFLHVGGTFCFFVKLRFERHYLVNHT